MKKLLSLILIFLPIVGQANNSFKESAISTIILHDAGSILVKLKDGITTNESCNNTSLVLQSTNRHYKEMYAALLAAYHSGSKVGGWVDTCDTKFNQPVLTRLDLSEK
ncbi:MAG: hypothetical protein RPR97_12775 [Colwellia sp.]|jgi:hypothetical protein